MVPRGVEVYEINGPFFFGAAEKFKDTLSEVSRKPKVLIIRMRNVPAIDSTAMHALRDLVRRTRKDGTVVYFSDVQAQPLLALSQSELLWEIGEEHLFGDIDEALAASRRHLETVLGLEELATGETEVCFHSSLPTCSAPPAVIARASSCSPMNTSPRFSRRSSAASSSL